MNFVNSSFGLDAVFSWAKIGTLVQVRLSAQRQASSFFNISSPFKKDTTLVVSSNRLKAEQ